MSEKTSVFSRLELIYTRAGASPFTCRDVPIHPRKLRSLSDSGHLLMLTPPVHEIARVKRIPATYQLNPESRMVQTVIKGCGEK